jgi:hypothetical protein
VLLSVDTRQVFRFLCLVIIALLCLHCATMAVRMAHLGSLGRFVRLFDLDTEANVPTFCAVLQLACAAVLLMVIGLTASQRGFAFARHWLVLGAVFTFLSLDELAHIHESLSASVRRRLHVEGFFHFAWVIPYGILTAMIGIAYLRFLMHLPRRTRRLMVLSALVYVGGAIGMELYGGYLHTRPGAVAAPMYMTEVLIEEGMEMFGSALFIYTLLDYLQGIAGQIRITIGAGCGRQRPQGGSPIPRQARREVAARRRAYLAD